MVAWSTSVSLRRCKLLSREEGYSFVSLLCWTQMKAFPYRIQPCLRLFFSFINIIIYFPGACLFVHMPVSYNLCLVYCHALLFLTESAWCYDPACLLLCEHSHWLHFRTNLCFSLSLFYFHFNFNNWSNDVEYVTF